MTEIFDCMNEEIILVSRWGRNREKGGRERGFDISCFVESDALAGREWKEKVIRKESSKVWWYRVEKNVHFLKSVFYFDIVFVSYDVGQV